MTLQRAFYYQEEDWRPMPEGDAAAAAAVRAQPRRTPAGNQPQATAVAAARAELANA